MDSGTLIRRARTQADMSQRDLATRAGTSAAAICLYETGQRQPRVDTLSRILAAAGATLMLDASQPVELDMAVNGSILVQVLDLAEQLPFADPGELDAPVFAELAQ